MNTIEAVILSAIALFVVGIFVFGAVYEPVWDMNCTAQNGTVLYEQDCSIFRMGGSSCDINTFHQYCKFENESWRAMNIVGWKLKPF